MLKVIMLEHSCGYNVCSHFHMVHVAGNDIRDNEARMVTSVTQTADGSLLT